jgi:hypothetical protein
MSDSGEVEELDLPSDFDISEQGNESVSILEKSASKVLPKGFQSILELFKT